jgi:glycosyltransferase involved in cell wall biosynthesis
MVSDFTVLLPVYKKDNPYKLNVALNSIYANTLQPKNVILIADGELTEDLLHVVKFFSSNFNMQLCMLPSNVGLASALNIGLSLVNTKYVVRADADDYNYQNRFSLILERLDSGYDLVGSAIREIDIDDPTPVFRAPPLTEVEIRAFVKKRNPFNHMSVGFRTCSVLSAGGYPPIYLKEDYALWATLLARNCKACNLAAVLVDASAGKEMLRRRSGFRYALAEIELQRHLVRCGLKSPLSALLDGALRSMIFLAPNAMREFIYLNFLRSRKVGQ